MPLYLGIDIGTSGVRTSVIGDTDTEVASASVNMPAPIRIDERPCQDATIWWEAVRQCLRDQATSLREAGRQFDEITAMAVDGTSGTLLLTDADLNPLTLGYLYNSANFTSEAEAIARYAPETSMARGAGFSLARLLFLQKQVNAGTAKHALHQADWIAAKLMGQGGFSDETNVLKMGFDLEQRIWPDWFCACGVELDLLPDVKPVGEMFGVVEGAIAKQFGFSHDVKVIAGTTDSNAAFLASGASQIGEGVTSLGTTLAIKLLSEKPVTDASRGVYSHRIKDMWLPGGASNSGGGVLLDHFTAQRMSEMETELIPESPTGLDYYPLSRPGERFPINDPNLQPRLTPRPENDLKFFQALLEGLSEIERIAYTALEELGAPTLKRVFTAGGGAQNQAWTRIRSAKLGVPVVDAQSSNASTGVARIAAGLI
ncbi:MAG: carbohydrate kinase [Verrucomicrobiales bacterium]|nr:carbohydrate kinase [Verrucomicrobiales bacterium]|tara:strand:+ start:5329 stop:6615 length:1287 start_codon:yes stop_codon:yes gene_type:complete